METYYDTVLNSATGQPAPGITVKVFSSGTTVLAPSVSLNSDGSTSNNPLTTDAYGFYQFYAPDGYYDLGYYAGDELLRLIPNVHLLSGLVAWQPTGLIPVFVDANEFTVSGDRTSLFFVGQRVRILINPSTYIYGTVQSSVFGATDTTIAVTGLTGPITSGIASVNVGIGDPNKAIDFSTISVTFPLVGPLGASIAISGTTPEVNADPVTALGIVTKQYADAITAAETAARIADVNAEEAARIADVDAEEAARIAADLLLAPKYLPIITEANANRTLVLSDDSKYIRMTNAAANTVTVPLNATVAFPVGTQISVMQAGAGQTTITPIGGVTLNSTPTLKTRAQYSALSLIKVATDTWDVVGDLAAT